MLKITYEQFLTLNRYLLSGKSNEERLKNYFKDGPLSALDILNFDNVKILDKFWAVLREELIPAHALHEFGCRIAERALSKVKDPDPRSIEAIRAKRLWIKGEITDEELEAARNAAWNAAGDTAREIIWEATSCSSRTAALDAVWSAARSATNYNTEQQWQIKELIKILEEVI